MTTDSTTIPPHHPPIVSVETIPEGSAPGTVPYVPPASVIPDTGEGTTSTTLAPLAEDLPETGSSMLLGGVASLCLVVGVLVVRLTRRTPAV